MLVVTPLLQHCLLIATVANLWSARRLLASKVLADHCRSGPHRWRKKKRIGIDRRNRIFNLTTSIRFLTLSIRFWNRNRFSIPNPSLNVDGSLISDQIKVANHFNRFFTTVAEKIVNELPAQIGIFNDKLVKEYYAKCGIMTGGFLFTK